MIGVATALTARPATAADDAQRRAIFRSTREQALASIGWPAATIESFCDQQFDIREQSLDMSRPAAERSVIMLSDGCVAGEMIVDRTQSPWVLVDIALLVDARNQGVGASVLNRFLDEADTAGAAVELHVDLANPARSLYERLGFELCGSDELQHHMRRPPTREDSE